MSMNSFLRLVLGPVVSTVATTGALSSQIPSAAPACHERKDLVAPCYTVRGALRYYNGAPGVRIWVIGTTHLLGLRGFGERGLPPAGACPLPDGLRDTLEAGKEVIGDFRVCPLTTERPGVMQDVCVDSASRIRAKAYRF